MGQLNVNPADLMKAAGDYSDLAVRAAQLPPQVIAEIQAIAASHGPMGYPVAVGMVAGLASREGAVQSKATQYGDYADRFTGHAAAYTAADRAAARQLEAIVFPQSHVDPTPPPTTPTPYPVVCWLPSPGADPAKYCPAETTRIQYVDGQGQWVQKDIKTGANEVILNGVLPGTQYLPAPPTGPAPPGITDRLWPDEHGNLVHQREGQAGEPPKIDVKPPGRISW